MRAIAEPKDSPSPKTANSVLTDRSPLVEKEATFPVQKASFDNMALCTEPDRNGDRDSRSSGGGGRDLGSAVSEDMFLSPSPTVSSVDSWECQPEWTTSRTQATEKKKSKPLLKLVSTWL